MGQDEHKALERPSVTVVMSTYNGAVYLREQIDSILKQEGVRVALFVRDDGSSDETLEILESYGGLINLAYGDNVGVGQSFMKCLYSVGAETGYYAFSDQDDIWDADKLSSAISHISDFEGPVLYCSNQLLVDHNGSPIGARWDEPPGSSYLQILNNNELSGCTMVWNRELQVLLIDPERRPSANLLGKRIHDVWVAMVASVIGLIVYDNVAHIEYRQHGGNVVGVKSTTRLQEWRKKGADRSLRNGRSDLCRELVQKYGDLISNDEVRNRLMIYGLCRYGAKYKFQTLLDSELVGYSSERPIETKAKVFFNLF